MCVDVESLKEKIFDFFFFFYYFGLDLVLFDFDLLFIRPLSHSAKEISLFVITLHSYPACPQDSLYKLFNSASFWRKMFLWGLRFNSCYGIGSVNLFHLTKLFFRVWEALVPQLRKYTQNLGSLYSEHDSSTHTWAQRTNEWIFKKSLSKCTLDYCRRTEYIPPSDSSESSN